MGNAINFRVNFMEVCANYYDDINYIIRRQLFANKNVQLEKLVSNYIYFYEHTIINKKEGDLIVTDQSIRIIWSVHKLHPVDYSRRKQVDSEWLINACLRQYGFNGKIIKEIKREDLNSSKLKNGYVSFLKLCKKFPTKTIVPTPLQDFMWHSHMQDHLGYIEDTKNYLGRILNHDDDIDPKLLEKYRKETEYLKKNVKYSFTGDSYCVTPVFYATCGSCSSCGGG